jgi:hypothetical protein
MWSWLRRRREQEPVTEEITVVDERTAPVSMVLPDEGEAIWPPADPYRTRRVVFARSLRAQAALAAFRNVEPESFDWAGRFYIGDEVDRGEAFVDVWNRCNPHAPVIVWDLDVVLAEANAIGALAGQLRGER